MQKDVLSVSHHPNSVPARGRKLIRFQYIPFFGPMVQKPEIPASDNVSHPARFLVWHALTRKTALLSGSPRVFVALGQDVWVSAVPLAVQHAISIDTRFG